jgi:hypothetical protein
MRAIADVEPALYVDADFLEHFDFSDERRRIDHDAGANHSVLRGPQNSARNQLQHVAVFADDDGVAGVVAAGDARDVIERAREIVDDFTFSFVTPLRADHYDRFHSRASPQSHIIAKASVASSVWTAKTAAGN